MDSDRSENKTSFIGEDDGLASLAEAEAGFSGKHRNNHFHARSMGYASNRGSLRNLSICSPRSGRYYDARFEDSQPHFLDSCFLCNKPLNDNRDIFMYRGDTPFCSEECRQEQIEMDEAKEKNWNLSSSMKALRKKEQTKSTSPNKTQDYSFRTSTVAAA